MRTPTLSRILMRASVVYVSTADPELVRGYHMIPASTLPEAMEIAEGILHNNNATVTAIPDGVSVMVTK